MKSHFLHVKDDLYHKLYNYAGRALFRNYSFLSENGYIS